MYPRIVYAFIVLIIITTCTVPILGDRTIWDQNDKPPSVPIGSELLATAGVVLNLYDENHLEPYWATVRWEQAETIKKKWEESDFPPLSNFKMARPMSENGRYTVHFLDEETRKRVAAFPGAASWKKAPVMTDVMKKILPELALQNRLGEQPANLFAVHALRYLFQDPADPNIPPETVHVFDPNKRPVVAIHDGTQKRYITVQDAMKNPEDTEKQGFLVLNMGLGFREIEQRWILGQRIPVYSQDEPYRLIVFHYAMLPPDDQRSANYPFLFSVFLFVFICFIAVRYWRVNGGRVRGARETMIIEVFVSFFKICCFCTNRRSRESVPTTNEATDIDIECGGGLTVKTPHCPQQRGPMGAFGRVGNRTGKSGKSAIQSSAPCPEKDGYGTNTKAK